MTESRSACGSGAFVDVLGILLALALTATDIDVIDVGPVVIVIVVVFVIAFAARVPPVVPARVPLVSRCERRLCFLRSRHR